MLLSLIKSTASKNGGFINKLQAKSSVVTVFGTKESQITFYMKTANQVPVGTSGDLPLDMFNVVEREYTIDDPQSENNGETIMCKWLELRPAQAPVVAAPVVQQPVVQTQPVVQPQVLPTADLGATSQPVVN